MSGLVFSGVLIVINISHNIDQQLGFLSRLHDQFPFAVAVALTKTAVDIEKATVDAMRRDFDRPTPYTLRAFYVSKATKHRLVASIELKDRRLSKVAAAANETIGHQFTGGTRNTKSLERYAQRAGLISSGEYLVPSVGAPLDRYGNLSRGQTAKIMSQLRLGLDEYAWQSKSRRSRASRRLDGYFWSRGGRLPRGVWLRAGTGVKPVLMVAAGVAYPKLIDVDRIGMRITNAVFERHLSQAWSRAIATAR